MLVVVVAFCGASFGWGWLSPLYVQVSMVGVCDGWRLCDVTEALNYSEESGAK